MPIIRSLPPVTPAECAQLQGKKPASAAVQDLYQTYPYLTAYARHTDLRVEQDGPAAAVGGDWDAGGKRQFDFLVAHGVTPATRVLDFGCGTGRLARWLVPYLRPGYYTGMDLSVYALVALQELAHVEGWETQGFTLVDGDGTLNTVAGQTFDVIWAYAVFIHLPTVVLEALFESLQHVTFDRFYFTYKHASLPRRSALKQFGTPLVWYQKTAQRYGFHVAPVHDSMPWIPQVTGVITCR